MTITKNCVICGGSFTAFCHNGKYCSGACKEVVLKKRKQGYYYRNRERLRKKSKDHHIKNQPLRKKWFQENWNKIKPKQRWRDRDGYIILGFGRGVAYQEHRWLIAKKKGRLLRKWETVHHKNRIRDDNRIENLEFRPEQGHYPRYDSLMKYIKTLEEKIKSYECGKMFKGE